MPTRVRDLAIPEADLPLLARDTLKNFNANAGSRSESYVDEMLQLLKAAHKAMNADSESMIATRRPCLR